MKRALILLILLVCLLTVISCGHTHSWEREKVILEPTEEKDGLALYTCKECGEKEERILEKIPHLHIFAQSWSTNENEHYHPCIQKGCTETENKGNHNFTESIIKEATGSEAGEIKRECIICQYQANVPYHLGEEATNEEWREALSHKMDNQTILYKDSTKELKIEYANGWIQYTKGSTVTQDINKGNRELSSEVIKGIFLKYVDIKDKFTYNTEKRFFEYKTDTEEVLIQITNSRVTRLEIKNSEGTVAMELSSYGKTSFTING